MKSMLRRVLRRFGSEPALLLIGGVLAAALLVFIAGVAIERATLSSPSVACTQQQKGETGTEPGESPGEHKETACVRERVLGVAVDDPSVVTLIALGWLALLAGLFRFGRRALPVVALAAGAALVFDGAEVLSKVREGSGILAGMALVVALGHAAAAVLAVLVLTGHATQINDRLQALTRQAGATTSPRTAEQGNDPSTM